MGTSPSLRIGVLCGLALAACTGGDGYGVREVMAPPRPVNPPSLGSGGTRSTTGSARAGSNATPAPSIGAGGSGSAVAAIGVSGAPSVTASSGAPEIGASGLPDVVFTMEVMIPANAEQLKCLYAAFPGDRGVIAVNSAESHYTPGSHHFLAYRSDLIGVPADQAGIFDCQDSDFQHNKGSYYEAQQPDSMRALPDGIAHKFQPNEVVILQAHYLNTTTADIDAHVTFVLHTIDPATVKQEAGSILWSDINLRLPPHARTRATMTCPLPVDFNPAELWSHMHHRGSNFIATSDDKSVPAGPIYTEADWSEPQPRDFPGDPPMTLHAGSHITFSCDFTNDTDDTITFGNSAQTNEMCILHGMYWPRNTQNGMESCRGGMTMLTPLQ